MIDVQVAFSLTILIVASVYDLYKREVPNRLWILSLPFAAILTILNIWFEPSQLTMTIISITVTSMIALLIFYLGLFGGADAKALIVLAIAHPLAPPTLMSFPLLPITTLNNSLLLMVCIIPFTVLRNMYWKFTSRKSLFHELEREPLFKKIGALFLAVKTPKRSLKPYHVLAETANISNNSSQKQLDLFQQIPEADLIIDETVSEDVFIMMSLPMLPFITLAYLLTLIQGDLILQLLTLFM
jgi:preflagellin peptidase FlaK